MLKTRITEQYGLKVPFINAGMAFIATAPLVRAVCSAGGMGMLGSAAMPPDVLQAAIRDIKGAPTVPCNTSPWTSQSGTAITTTAPRPAIRRLTA
jgi:NAD(P)H-dependent flavin oxidoreductase YrpB (nitropropane dioxygenase family)